MQDILKRKRKYQDLDLSFDERLDGMLERRWNFGTWLIVISGAVVIVGLLVALGNVVIGLN